MKKRRAGPTAFTAAKPNAARGAQRLDVVGEELVEELHAQRHRHVVEAAPALIALQDRDVAGSKPKPTPSAMHSANAAQSFRPKFKPCPASG
jgi:hypothetical protein